MKDYVAEIIKQLPEGMEKVEIEVFLDWLGNVCDKKDRSAKVGFTVYLQQNKKV